MVKLGAFAVVFDARGRVLLCLRRDRDLWNLPGGGVEPDETVSEGLVREVREETGLDLEDVRLQTVRTLGRHVEVIFTARGIGEPQVMSREITELRWFEIDSMPPEISRDQRNLVTKALERE